MPKRNSDTSVAMSANDKAPPVKVQKTERSHEENQERAYIAASRRADRSLEARVQSAKMASEIHRRRTGRGLKVSEEIVLKEEMYEEDEDDLPRQYRYLTAHIQTNSPEMNQRVNAYITTQAAMATMARYNEVNRLFSESFPSAMAYQQQLNNSMYMAPLMNTAPLSPKSSGASPTRATPSASAQSQLGDMDRKASTASAASAVSTTTVSSPPALSPASTSTNTSDSRETPFQTPTAFPSLPLDPQLAQQSTKLSVFTSELPNESKIMANIDMNDPMAAHFLGDNSSAFPMYSQYFGDASSEGFKAQTHSEESPNVETILENCADNDELLFSPIEGSMGYYDLPTTGYSRLGTPGCGMGNDAAWESLIDFGSEQ
ncbi:hypothetical protein F5X99DRAFT_302212 [Biscogniauxia marginata]|nr:hypothetical protein F5X99DRAFT_302212 [Biscogniauxia marginata]